MKKTNSRMIVTLFSMLALSQLGSCAKSESSTESAAGSSAKEFNVCTVPPEDYDHSTLTVESEPVNTAPAVAAEKNPFETMEPAGASLLDE